MLCPSLQGCGIDTMAEIGSIFTVVYAVQNSAGQTASAVRTVAIGKPCPDREELCPDLSCSPIRCDLR